MGDPVIVLDTATLTRLIREVVAEQLRPLIDAITAAAPRPADDVMLTREDVANILGIDARSLRRLELARVLPVPIRLGRRVRWSRRAIDEFIAAGGASEKKALQPSPRGRSVRPVPTTTNQPRKDAPPPP